jgi:precorrin-6B methylase 2
MEKKLFTFVLILMALVPAAATAQVFQPTVGQEGKDVIWVPTPNELINAMLDLAKVTPSDFVMDLGSGDGRIVIAAAKRGAHAMGIEFNPDMVELSRASAKKEGVADRATFQKADIFETDLSKATVITMYLLPSLNMKLRPKILDLKPGTRIVTHAFTMEDWEPDQSISVEERMGYLWIVPAKVAGTWTSQVGPASGTLTIKQAFQKFDGTVNVNGKNLPLSSGKMDGDKIGFVVGDTAYSGRVSGGVIDGTAKAGTAVAVKWTAKRNGTQ